MKKYYLILLVICITLIIILLAGGFNKDKNGSREGVNNFENLQNLTGYVVFLSNPECRCPKGAICEPCQIPFVIISVQNDNPINYSEEYQLKEEEIYAGMSRITKEKRDIIKVGERYVFSLKIFDTVHTTQLWDVRNIKDNEIED